MKTNLSIYLIILISLVLSACATMVMPEGGDVDNTPPVPESFLPPNRSTNMHKNKIVIRFDEFIILSKLTQQLVVSPQMIENPNIFIQGKKLVIELPDSLMPNTTYTLFFGDAVVNFKENLPVHNFSYVFSTGDVLDSLMLRGTAVNAFDHHVYEELFILLYKSLDDSVLYNKKPYYLIKTEKNGDFRLNNLSPGNYQIFALKDVNRNYIYDQPSEEIAFYDSLVIPYHPSTFVKDTADTTALEPPPLPSAIKLYAYTETPKEVKLLSNRVISQNKILFTFNSDIQDFKLLPIGFESDTIWHFDTKNPTGDSIFTYLMGVEKDTIFVSVADGNNILEDSLRLILVKKKRSPVASRRKKKEEDAVETPKPIPAPKLVFKNNLSQSFPFFGEVSLKFSVPLIAFHFDRIELYKAKDTLWIPINFEAELSDTINNQKIIIHSEFSERERYKLLVRDSTFFDIYHATNDSIKSEFLTTEMRQYGSLKLIVNYSSQKSLIVQLLNEKDKVIYSQLIQASGNIKYPYLPDGKYKIKAILDENGNGKWDNGDLQTRRQPEKIYFIPQLIDIRANWDNEQVWNIED